MTSKYKVDILKIKYCHRLCLEPCIPKQKGYYKG